MKKLLFALLLAGTAGIAQQGVKFEKGSWQEIQAKAKAENKYIFMDAFTTWCGPCKYMANTIFPKPEMGAFFNANFVNVKVQLDTTKADNDEVKSWYADGHKIMTDYKVNAFPTFLVFNPSGKLVHKIIGGAEAEPFLAKAKDALNPEKQYYTMLDEYNGGKKDPAFLMQLALAAGSANESKILQKVAEEYLAKVQDLFTAENIKFIGKTTNSTSDKGFKLMLNNQDKFDKINGAGSSEKKIIDLILYTEIMPQLYGKKAKSPDWIKMNDELTKAYPSQADELIATSKVSYYQNNGDWMNFQKEIVRYMKKYGSKVSEGQLNTYAWTVFENCPDMNCVKDALAWSKRSFKDNNNPMFIDTYANILYKMGQKKEAIDWQTKAIALVPVSEVTSYNETLEKMKKGEKTWKH